MTKKPLVALALALFAAVLLVHLLRGGAGGEVRPGALAAQEAPAVQTIVPAAAEPDAPVDVPERGDWEVLADIPKAWYENCHDGAMGRLPANIDRMEHQLSDGALDDEARARVEAQLANARDLSTEWDVRLCLWTFAP